MAATVTHDHQRRLETLREKLDAEGFSGALVSRPEHVFYLSGLVPGLSPAFLLVLAQRTIAIAPSAIGDFETVPYTDYDIHNGWSIVANTCAALRQAFGQAGLKHQKVGVETGHLPAALLAAIAPEIGGSADLADVFWHMRRIKDETETAQIAANVRGNDRMFEALRDAARPGKSELDLWSVAYQALCENAGEPVALEADLGAGARTSNPDVKPGHHQLHTGDSILADVYSATHGYYADTTRNFVLGQPTPRQREIHAILEDALAAGESLLTPGTRACDVDAAVRRVVERAGFGPNFPHHAGHSYGLFQQERPFLIPADTLPLEPGMILTLEPGIYIENWGGMRLEGNYVITDSGARRLDQFPTGLIVCR